MITATTLPDYEQPYVIRKEVEECNLCLHYRRDLNVLSVRWQRCTASEKLRKAYLEMLQMASVHNCHYWMIDLRGRGASSLEENYWVLEVFFDLIKNKFPSCVYIAYLMAPSYYDVVVPRIPEKQVSAYSNSVKVKMFTSESDVYAWLLRYQY